MTRPNIQIGDEVREMTEEEYIEGDLNDETSLKLTLRGKLASQIREAHCLVFSRLFEQNKFYDLALKYAKVAVEFNPNDFDSWKMYYSISKSTPEEKAMAFENMKRLDPLTPAYLG